MAPQLIACPACECHAKSSESACPHCGAPLRRESNYLPRSATAIALGLSAVLTATGCEPEDHPVYGVAMTGGFGGDSSSSSSSSSGQGGMGGSQGGMGGMAGQGGAGGAGGMGGAGGAGGMGGGK